MIYRKDLQILRGIAVLLVVLFHLEVSGMESGFLGVDVFFVISGFLMAVLYRRGETLNFINRRARRILPAYFATIIASLLVAVLVTLPTELNQVVGQSVFSTFLSPNIGFWSQDSYFDSRLFNPLLHLWSLGVEVQFYLVVPLVAWLLCKNRSLLALIALTSMVLCFSALYISPKTAFFMTPLRMWEFLIGYGAAVYLTTKGNVKYENRGWIGAAAILIIAAIPFIPIDGAKQSVMIGHPGLIALLINVATAAVLVFGLPTVATYSKLGTVLETLGKYSYSVYLVHFPVIAFYFYEPFSGTSLGNGSVIDTVVVLLIICLSTVALYHLVEKRSKVFTITKAVPIAGAATLLFSIVAYSSTAVLYSKEEIKVFSAWSDRGSYRCGRVHRVMNPSNMSCLTTDGLGEKGNVLLVGNSHANAIKYAFSDVAMERGYGVYFLVYNAPLMNKSLGPVDLIEEAKRKGVDKIVLHFSPTDLKVSVLVALVQLAESAGVQVSLLMPVPVYKESIPEAIWYNLASGKSLPAQSITDYYQRNHAFIDGVKRINSRIFESFDTAGAFCKGICSFIGTDGRPYYYDDGHLTLSGARVLKNVFHQVFDRWSGTQEDSRFLTHGSSESQSHVRSGQ